jgi:hypothetical protein
LVSKSVFRSPDGRFVWATGTGAADDIRNPINTTTIVCMEARGTCEMSVAEFIPHNSGLYFWLPDLGFEIKTWGPNRVTAINEYPCFTAVMTIDVQAKAVTIVTVRRAVSDCSNAKTPSTWALVDGFDVSWKLHRGEINNARALVYEPARRLAPP